MVNNRTIQNMKIIFYSFLIVLLIAGCNQGKRIKIGDDKPNNEARLIVTNSDALEMLIGLGAAENVVGINDTKLQSFVAPLQTWPIIGHWRNPNIEAITNLNPDIVVAYKRYPDSLSFDVKLRPFNISVERMDCYRMSEYHSDVSRLASFVGKENEADTIINDFNKIIDIIKSTVADIDVKRRVYFEFSDFTAMGQGTGSHEILEMANATNIAFDLKVQYPKISTEWLLEENPDIIIKTITADTITTEMYDRIVTRAGWDKLDAVKNKKVFLISSELCSGPRAMIGSLYIGKWCYPEKFASTNPDSIHSHWMKKYYGVTTAHNKYIFTPKI